MQFEICKTVSVPLRDDNRESVRLIEGETLDTDKFKKLSKEQIDGLQKDGVLKKPAPSLKDSQG